MASELVKDKNKWKVLGKDKEKIANIKEVSNKNGEVELEIELKKEYSKNLGNKISLVSKNEKDEELDKKQLMQEESGSTEGETDSSDKETESKAKKSYDVPVAMKTYDNRNSMANGAIDKKAHIVDDGETSEVTLQFKPLKRGSLVGRLIKMSVDGKDVKVLTRGSKGEPSKISFKVKGHPEKIKASVEVDVMNELAGEPSPQDVYIALDWSKKENERTIDDSKEKAEVERISGENRVETSLAISKKYFTKADNAILVSSKNYSDALVSAAYAKMKDAPTLLAAKDRLSPETIKELKRLEVKEVTIIGGEKSISKKVEKELKDNNISIRRISGEDRYETSRKLAEEFMESNEVKKLALVNGYKNADALSFSAMSTKENIPVVLVRNSDKNKELAAKVKEWKLEEIMAIGGRSSISENTLRLFEADNKTRIAGSNKYETALEIAKATYPNPKSVFISNGDTLIDALSAGSVTHKEEAPIILTKKDSVKFSVRNFINGVKKHIIVGGTNSIDESISE